MQLKNLIVGQHFRVYVCCLPLTERCQASDEYQASSICLLEFDHRFNVFQEFVHYDYEYPLALPGRSITLSIG